MYSFEGQFRRKPQQSFGGASKKLERTELLHQIHSDRQQREDKRKQNAAATSIQSWFRGSLLRARQHNTQRINFDLLIKNLDCSSSNINQKLLDDLIKRLAFFYNFKNDLNRLNTLTQVCVKISSTLTNLTVENSAYWVPKLQKLSKFNLDALSKLATSTFSVAIPLRFIEIFTSCDSYLLNKTNSNNCDNKCEVINKILNKLWTTLLQNSYFTVLRLLLDHRVPESLITSEEPPTPLAEALLQFLIRPLCFQKSANALKLMMTEFFTNAFSPQIHCFLLPALISKSMVIDTDVFLQSFIISDSKPYFLSSEWVMYALVSILSKRVESMSQYQLLQYLEVLKYLSICFSSSRWSTISIELNGYEDSDDEDRMHKGDSSSNQLTFNIVEEVIAILNQPNHVNVVVNILQSGDTFKNAIVPVCCFAYFLLDQDKLSIYNYRLLYTLAFKPIFLRELWNSIISSCTLSVFGQSTPLVQYLSQGLTLSSSEQEKFIPQLTLFCALLNHFLSTLHDFEFYGDEDASGMSGNHIMPFSLPEIASISLVLRDVCMGLINLAYPEIRPFFNNDYIKAMQSVGANAQNKNVNKKNVKIWNQLFKYVVLLLRHLYSRDARRNFCPKGQWIAEHFAIPFNRAAELNSRKRYGYEPFVGLHPLTREELEEEGPPPSAMEVRQIAVLQEFPFVINFPERVKIFHSLITKDKEKNQGDLVNFRMGPQIHALIRRNFIYEDAFDNLSPENEPNLKLKVVVQLVNAVGLDEVGIDGGGIFREFLNELLKTCFDPNRGFFKTTHDCLLYPNPGVHHVLPDFTKHYYFIGRMLGKAIYENMLVELPFAEFFLAKILSRHSSDVDIHHLASLDPLMYKNLLYLKTYEGDISDLGLDFTVMSSELGENEVVELKPGGAGITVTENNRITYIHLMADYKLNKQIKAQCQAFKEGLANVIDLEWLYMFDPNELQVLISGAQVPIDINDLKAHTNYAGGYYDDHPVIVAFWNVVESFDERRRRQLLKFVTSCSRPPLLGFKELTPAFCIQNAGREPNRLPTASTCMNLLKLPEFQTEEVLRTKLLYAIESGAGFELS